MSKIVAVERSFVVYLTKKMSGIFGRFLQGGASNRCPSVFVGSNFLFYDIKLAGGILFGRITREKTSASPLRIEQEKSLERFPVSYPAPAIRHQRGISVVHWKFHSSTNQREKVSLSKVAQTQQPKFVLTIVLCPEISRVPLLLEGFPLPFSLCNGNVCLAFA